MFTPVPVYQAQEQEDGDAAYKPRLRPGEPPH